jgi:hypothetical protein
MGRGKKIATWEKVKEEEKKRMKVENDKLKLKQTYLEMKEIIIFAKTNK